MRKVSDIYKEYKLMPTLAEHMLRVTAVAIMICDSLTVPVDKENLILACLLHDMGNVIKFKTGALPEFYEPEGIEYWENIKNEYVNKYGNNEDKATIEIMRELGVSEGAISLVDQNKFPLVCKHRDSGDLNIKIMHYADGRVAPKWIVTYQERMDEAALRYNGRDGITLEERAFLVECGREIEDQIFRNSNIKPEDITSESATTLIEELRNFVI